MRDLGGWGDHTWNTTGEIGQVIDKIEYSGED